MTEAVAQWVDKQWVDKRSDRALILRRLQRLRETEAPFLEPRPSKGQGRA